MMFEKASLLYPPPGMSYWPSYQPPALAAVKLKDLPMLGTQLTPSAVRVRLVNAPKVAWCTSGPAVASQPHATQVMARLNGVLAVRGIPARTSLLQQGAQFQINVDLVPGTSAQGLPTELDGVRINYFMS